MADLRYAAHRSPHHGMPWYRAEMFGHRNTPEGGFGVSENVGGSNPTPEMAVSSWLNSPGHRRAILNREAVSIGAGRVHDRNTTVKFGF
jgi:uncharacterized protein YkwD